MDTDILRSINFINKAQPFEAYSIQSPGVSVTVGKDYPFDKCREAWRNNKQDRDHMLKDISTWCCDNNRVDFLLTRLTIYIYYIYEFNSKILVTPLEL